ncbi:MAG TPA: restriction endonuclease, partial [Armatimonadota bacterium]|nr:restriction endonuclease [Armatimonadota bacterium]
MSVVSVILQEWTTATPADTPALARLRLSVDARVQSQLDALRTQQVLEIRELWSGVEISATSFIGRVRIGDLQITITPKLQGIPLWELFRYAYGLRNLRRYAAAEFNPRVSPFQDLLISLLQAEAEELVVRGLHRRYIRQTGQLTSPRGRLELAEIVRGGGATSATLPCSYYTRLEDCPINQALLAGLRFASSLTSDVRLRSSLHRVIRQLDEEVSAVRLTHAFLQSVMRSSTRLTRAYEPALRIISLLMNGMGIPLDDTSPALMLDGFLFDMNRFYQALLTRFLREHLPERYQIQSEYRMEGLFAYQREHNPRNRHAPIVRPDLVVMCQRKIAAILDAKYRDLWERELPREMLYQLSLYALSREQHRQATILYPTTEYAAREACISLRPFDGVLSA